MAFFEGNLKFTDEISFTISILGFSYVSPDTARRTQYLVFDMSSIVNRIAQFDDLYGKLKTHFFQRAFHVNMIAFSVEDSRFNNTRYRSQRKAADAAVKNPSIDG